MSLFPGICNAKFFKINEKENIGINNKECSLCLFSHDKQIKTICCKKPICTDCYEKTHKKCPYCRSSMPDLKSYLIYLL